MNTNRNPIQTGAKDILNRMVINGLTFAIVGMAGVLTFAQFNLWA